MSKKLNWDNASRVGRAIRHGNEHAFNEFPQAGKFSDKLRYISENKNPKSVKNQIEDLACPICNDSFPSEFDLFRHLSNKHKKCICSKCGYLVDIKKDKNPCPNCNHIETIKNENFITRKKNIKTGMFSKKIDDKEKHNEESVQIIKFKEKYRNNKKQNDKKEKIKSNPKKKHTKKDKGKANIDNLKDNSHHHSEDKSFGNNLGELLSEAIRNKNE